MAKMTAKFSAAWNLFSKLVPGDARKLDPHKVDGQLIYERLHDLAWVWDHHDGEWVKIDPQDMEFLPFGSLFVDKDGDPTGIFRLRVMAHPEQIDEVVAKLRENLKVGEVSDHYPNRKGVGVRVYLTCKLD